MYITTSLHKARQYNFVEATLIPLMVLSIFVVWIPLIYKEATFSTTRYLLGILLGSHLVVWILHLFNIPRTKFIDIILTILFSVISTPVFLVLGLIGTIIMFVYPRSSCFVSYWMATLLLFTAGALVINNNESFLNKNKKVIVIFNHGSFIDYLLSAHALGYKGQWRIVYGTNLEKYPIFRFYLRRIGIPVVRTSNFSKAKSLPLIKKALDEGIVVGIFPEGTRGGDKKAVHKLIDFKDGAFDAACELHCCIYPIVFHDAYNYCRPDSFYVSPRLIPVTYGNEEIYPENKSSLDLKNETYNMMLRMLS